MAGTGPFKRRLRGPGTKPERQRTMTLGPVPGAVIGLLWFSALPAQARAEWSFLRWMERPASSVPSSPDEPARVEFRQLLSFDKERLADGGWPEVKQALKEGDVIAYWKDPWEARVGILFKLQLNSVAYKVFKYGHIAIVVSDPQNENGLRLFTSYPLTGPTTREDLDTLKYESWHAYRLTRWDRVDKKRFYEFIRIARKKTDKWYGYDLFGLVGMWNPNLQPHEPHEIAHRYICSTLIAAGLYYAGVRLEVSPRHGVADIVTPLQLVSSKGWIDSQPDVAYRASGEEAIPSPETIKTGDWADAESAHR